MKEEIEHVALQLKELLAYPDLGSHAHLLANPRNEGFLTGPKVTIKSRRFRQFQKTAPPWRTLAVDASLKSILDCGAFVVVLFKIAYEIWQLGSRRALEGIETQVQLFRSLLSARDQMATLEFGLAEKVCKHLAEGDIILMDRPLCLRQRSSVSVIRQMGELSAEVESRKVGMLGICKSSRLGVRGGAPLIGFLLHHAAKIGIPQPWIYYPLTDRETLQFRFGRPCVASFDATEDFAFRVDLGTTLTAFDDALRALGSVAALGEKFAYGYPYPLRSVHEACSISRTEVDICRQRLLEAVSEKGILPNLKFALKATSFREEVLLS